MALLLLQSHDAFFTRAPQSFYRFFELFNSLLLENNLSEVFHVAEEQMADKILGFELLSYISNDLCI